MSLKAGSIANRRRVRLFAVLLVVSLFIYHFR